MKSDPPVIQIDSSAMNDALAFLPECDRATGLAAIFRYEEARAIAAMGRGARAFRPLSWRDAYVAVG